MALSPNVGSDRSWVYNVAADVCDGETSSETLAIRFANSESQSSPSSLRPPSDRSLTRTTLPDAGLFKSAFLSAQETNKSLLSNTAAPQEAVPADELAVKEEVKEEKAVETVEEKKEAPVEVKKEVVEEVIPISLLLLALEPLAELVDCCTGCSGYYGMSNRPFDYLNLLTSISTAVFFVRIPFRHLPLFDIEIHRISLQTTTRTAAISDSEEAVSMILSEFDRSHRRRS